MLDQADRAQLTALGISEEEAVLVARTMVRIFGVALGGREDYFAAFTDHSIDVLRMNNYRLPGPGTPLEPDQLGMGAHTDYGIVTVLWADQVPGLEILGADGSWHPVLPADGALLVNLGDAIARWTNEEWISTLHRVAAPRVGGVLVPRRSAAYFHDGNVDAVIEPLPGCVSAANPARYRRLPSAITWPPSWQVRAAASSIHAPTGGAPAADRRDCAREAPEPVACESGRCQPGQLRTEAAALGGPVARPVVPGGKALDSGHCRPTAAGRDRRAARDGGRAAGPAKSARAGIARGALIIAVAHRVLPRCSACSAPWCSRRASGPAASAPRTSPPTRCRT